MTLKIEKYGDKLLIPLPSDLAARLTWGHGDILAAEVVENGLQIKRTMSAHDHALEIANRCMEEYREAFETLAKS